MNSTLAILSCTLNFAVLSFPDGTVVLNSIRKTLGAGSIGWEVPSP